jgi:hypothetical protein
MRFFNLLVYLVYQVLSWLLGEPGSEWFPLIEEDVKVALRHGQWGAAEWLLQKGSFAPRLLSSDAILEAAREDDLMALRYILSLDDVLRCSAFWYDIPAPGDGTTRGYTTALHEACRESGLHFVRELLIAGMDPKCEDSFGLTPLDWALEGWAHDPQTITTLARFKHPSPHPSKLREAGLRRKARRIKTLRAVSEDTPFFCSRDTMIDAYHL